MKENGINKLIELLNESEDGFVSKFTEYDNMSGTFRLDNGQSFHYTLILSKENCFIKRLVENDKIDLEKVKNIKLPVDTKLRARVDKDEKTCFNTLYTLKLLMLLSIQDNQVEFLISILK